MKTKNIGISVLALILLSLALVGGANYLHKRYKSQPDLTAMEHVQTGYANDRDNGYNGQIGQELNQPFEGENMQSKFYSFTLNDIDGNPVSLSQYHGSVLLVVNVASKCGFTKQYAGLQQLYEKYKDQGFTILGFPANNFMGQEPGTDAEIKQFCTTRFNVTFPMFSKISVKGKQMHPLYQYLTSPQENGEFGKSITWNFNKFLIDKDGKTIGYFGSKTEPSDPQLTEAIEKALDR